MRDVQSCRKKVPPFALMPFGLAALAGLGLTLSAGAARAQVDLSGNWQPAAPFIQLVPNGPPPYDFAGVPLTMDGRAMGATSNLSGEGNELNRLCQLYLVDYFLDGPFGFEIHPITDPLEGGANVLAWYLSGTVDRPPETIWVDGRSTPPPQALHTWGGFATGQWRGDTLAVSITHLKDGWMLRNDAPQSNQATISMFLSREGNLLTETFIIHDPVYLSAPYARARTFMLTEASPTHSTTPTVNDCLPAEVIPGLSDGYHAARFLPGKNPQLTDPQQNFMMKNYGIPLQVALGGAQEMYPQFQKTLTKEYKRPPGYCKDYCGGPPGTAGAD